MTKREDWECSHNLHCIQNNYSILKDHIFLWGGGGGGVNCFVIIKGLCILDRI